MIPSWILELVGYAAAHASDDHGADCSTHADPEAACDCGVATAQELLDAVPEAVKGVALRAEPAPLVNIDALMEGMTVQERAAPGLACVWQAVSAMTAMGIIYEDLAVDLMRAALAASKNGEA